MSTLTTKAFWADAVERAVKTIAQTALALLSVSGADLLTLNYQGMLSAVLLAGLISVLTSIVSSSVTAKPDGSLVK